MVGSPKMLIQNKALWFLYQRALFFYSFYTYLSMYITKNSQEHIYKEITGFRVESVELFFIFDKIIKIYSNFPPINNPD